MLSNISRQSFDFDIFVNNIGAWQSHNVRALLDQILLLLFSVLIQLDTHRYLKMFWAKQVRNVNHCL